MKQPLYGLADPHLGLASGRSMERYRHWRGHPQTLFDAWDETVPPEAMVLLPGDLSLATKREDVLYDYGFLHARPGASKILSPGNHDRAIWKTHRQAQRACEALPSLLPLKGVAQRFAVQEGAPGLVIAATCGALVPGASYYDQRPENAQRYIKEQRRLRLALAQAEELRRSGDRLLVCLHYPPFLHGDQATVFSEMVEAAGAELCVYGHIHTPQEWESVYQGSRGSTAYRLLSADYLRMHPRYLGELSENGFRLAPL